MSEFNLYLAKNKEKHYASTLHKINDLKQQQKCKIQIWSVLVLEAGPD